MSAGVQQEQIAFGKEMANNLLVNPGFETWQRGAGPFASPPQFACDEWLVSKGGGADSISVQRSASSLFGSYCAEITYSGTPVWGGLSQGIESFASLDGLWLTFSVWVNCSVTDACTARILDYNGAYGILDSDRNVTSGSWEQLTVAKQLQTGLIGDAAIPHSFGINISILTWAACTVYVDGASLVIGNYPQGVPYLPLNPADDMTRCERFYELSGFYQDNNIFANSGGFGHAFHHGFSTKKHAAPTITFSNLVMFGTTASVTPSSANTGGLTINPGPAGAGPDQYHYWYCDNIVAEVT